MDSTAFANLERDLDYSSQNIDKFLHEHPFGFHRRELHMNSDHPDAGDPELLRAKVMAVIF